MPVTNELQHGDIVLKQSEFIFYDFIESIMSWTNTKKLFSKIESIWTVAHVRTGNKENILSVHIIDFAFTLPGM